MWLKHVKTVINQPFGPIAQQQSILIRGSSRHCLRVSHVPGGHGIPYGAMALGCPKKRGNWTAQKYEGRWEMLRMPRETQFTNILQARLPTWLENRSGHSVVSCRGEVPDQVTWRELNAADVRFKWSKLERAKWCGKKKLRNLISQQVYNHFSPGDVGIDHNS